MKYLKRFNESLVSKEVLKDILLELDDLGMTTVVYEGFIICIIPRDDSAPMMRIKWDEIKDCILRVKNYLAENFIRFSYRTFIWKSKTPAYNRNVTFNKLQWVDLNEKTKINDWIYLVRLDYKYEDDGDDLDDIEVEIPYQVWLTK